MGRIGCNLEGYLDDSKFSEPMPWIGIYVAVASLACLLAMGVDAFIGLRHKKLWFPCIYFSLNSTSLTILAAAIKLPMDLNSSMPRARDQLTKLSSSALICVAMGNFMPSLGNMENKEIIMNMMALSILVITLIVNVSVQMGTGVIYVFLPEHAVLLFLMVVMLGILSCSALTITTTRKTLKKKYKLKYQQARDEFTEDGGMFEVQKLKKDIKKSWMMARTFNPQYVMARLATTASSGAACLLSALILAEAMARSRWHVGSFKFCNGESEYKWSMILILVIQSGTVCVGLIATTGRWLSALTLKCKGQKHCWKNEFKIEKFWIQRLKEIKECPFAVQIRGRWCRKFVHELKNQCINMCIRAQMAVVLVSKFVQLASTFLFNQVCCLYCTIRRMHQMLQPQGSVSNQERGPKCSPSKKLDLNRFVLYLEGEEKLVELIASKSNDATDCYIEEGRKRKPTYLLELLNKSTMSDGFTGAREFTSDQITTLGSKEPSSSWSLNVVTLTGIAIALPNIDKHQTKWLLHGVSQGLKYVRIIEKCLDGKERMKNSRKAADIMWIEIDIYKQWLGKDLSKLASEGKSPKEILEGLAQIGNNHLTDFKKYTSSCGKGIDSIEWPLKVVAADSMQRHSLTLLMKYRNSNQTADKLYEWLCQTISDTLGACLTNLPYAISAKCFCHGIKKVEKNVYGAAYLLGETEEILKILGQHSLPELDPDQTPFIENWQFLMKPKAYFLPSTTSDNHV